ncbi:hypothetical protein APY04_1367 [Hyphomicrobium sulfonivorans]|uniref:Uncharacterized protein n=1 Tax=Hyphomicrobium sulfonivorans TaxID=121290 RepID=A0A120CWE4_HYPSL|nr:hypothetical protein [Hyphomicrobium sulfonivorans]KWT69284.1 hypothetical protein APY04_1367 [Hyphomicrobium sulfonivorans]
MTDRLAIAALLYPMVSGVLFGAGILPLMMLTEQAQYLAEWFPIIIVASLLLAAPICWYLAPRLRARSQRRKAQKSALQGQ